MRDKQSRNETRARELSLLAFGVAVLLLASPLRLLWARDGTHWVVPFGLWLGVVLLGALSAHWRDKRREDHREDHGDAP
jgi:uncharacterized membrane protein